MPSLVIGGLTIPVLDESWSATNTFIGGSSRGADGSLQEIGVGERKVWSFETPLLSISSARALHAFLTPGRSTAWDFEASGYEVYSSTGMRLGPSAYSNPGGRTGTTGLSINTAGPCSYTSCARTGVSLGFSAFTSGVWRSWWGTLSPAGVGRAWRDGVEVAYSLFQVYATLTLTSFTMATTLSVTGGFVCDDVVLITAETDGEYALAFHQRALAAVAAPFFPRLEAWGTLPRASGYSDAFKVQCRITGEKAVTARLPGVGLTDAVRLQVSMEQADAVK